MDRDMYEKLVAWSALPEQQARTIAYLAEHLGKFIKPRECVMLAFREHKPGNISWLMEQAVLRIDAIPVIWGPDLRWNTLLRKTFESRAIAVIGAPLVILGLTKLKKYNNTPLPIRKVVAVGYPCLGWVIDGIAKGLDCEVGGCFGIAESGVVAGFACGHSFGIHLREDTYGLDLVDGSGNPVPPGELGEMILYPKDCSEIRCTLGELARQSVTPCACGSDRLCLVDMQPGYSVDPDLYRIAQDLQAWTSILDCYLEKTESGFALEVVCFPGEKLPKFPSAAKLLMRSYDPKTDGPLWFFPGQTPHRNF